MENVIYKKRTFSLFHISLHSPRRSSSNIVLISSMYSSARYRFKGSVTYFQVTFCRFHLLYDCKQLQSFFVPSPDEANNLIYLPENVHNFILWTPMGTQLHFVCMIFFQLTLMLSTENRSTRYWKLPELHKKI